MTQLFRVTIPVRDLDLAVRFYSGLLGVAGERVSAGWHYFRFGQAILACHDAVAEGGRPVAPHAEPVFIGVDEWLDQLLIRARTLGARDLDAAVERLPTGESGFRLRDPFGNAIWVVDARTLQWGRSAGVASLPEIEAPTLLFQRDFLNAVKGGELARVKEFLALDSDLAASCDAAGVSALLLAAYKRHAELARHLLGLRQQLTIWEAAAFGQRGQLQELLQRVPQQVNAAAVDGYLPLGLAAFFGHADCVQLLLEHGAEVNAVSRNAMHVRPLHSAVTQAPAASALTVVRLLLDAGAEPNAAKSGGYTALHLAVNRDECGLAELLLRAGAAPEQRAGDGRSALDVARARGHAPMLALIEAHHGQRGAAVA